MKKTSIRSVVIMIVVAAVVSYLIELTLVSSGGLSIVPPISLPITLVAVAAGIIGLAVPVRRRVTGQRRAPLSPFYAVRVAVLAKSCSLTGSLLVGVGIGIIVHLMSRPFVNWTLLWPGIAQAVGSLILMVAGLVAERMCTLPPDNKDTSPVSPPETAGGTHA